MLGAMDTWDSPEWRALAVDWLDRRLAEHGVRRTGDVSQPHLQPWATALTAPTTRGAVWLKAMAPWTAGEIGVYEVLRRAAPHRVLEPIAVDAGRRWLLLPDGGPSLGERLQGDVLVEALVPVMAAYGRFQRDVAPDVGALLEAGVDDMRAAAMPARFEEALDLVGGYVDRDGSRADRDVLARVGALRDTYRGWCEELACSPIPPSLDHNDLHAWNVLGDVDAAPDGVDPGSGGAEADGGADADRRGGGRGSGRWLSRPEPVGVRFYDWGDAVVSHPFASMLMGLGFVRLYVEPGGDVAADPRVRRLRDAYLSAFADLGDHDQLVATLELACRVGKVARAVVWDRAVRAMGDGAGDMRRAPFLSLASLLDDSYVGVT
jgi:hypothetical protein